MSLTTRGFYHAFRHTVRALSCPTTSQMQLPILHMQGVINSIVCSAFPPFSTIPKPLLNLKLEKSYLIPFNLSLYSQQRVAYCSEVPKHFFASTFAVSLGLFFSTCGVIESTHIHFEQFRIYLFLYWYA